MHMIEARTYALLGLIGGIVLLAVGLITIGCDTVRCGDHVMSPHDVCRAFSEYSSTERTYEEQKAADRRLSLSLMIGGPTLAITSGGCLAWSSRRRAKSS
ncbi:hypothetical protein Arub01_47040 [Actinomadura rubrobrunea]|uniref:Uncharacterized protein n=2 Tax=Actinomadura rubrobrunea TaxID=115335 RepID=A0A9W6PXZ4_9ACTN|nr:hypothetical protein Arub01_47040 [Actinomadura rubrobrunea]